MSLIHFKTNKPWSFPNMSLMFQYRLTFLEEIAGGDISNDEYDCVYILNDYVINEESHIKKLQVVFDVSRKYIYYIYSQKWCGQIRLVNSYQTVDVQWQNCYF